MPEPAQALEGVQAFRQLVGIIGQAIVGQGICFGKQQHSIGVSGPGPKLVGVDPRLGRPADDQQHRPHHGSL